MNKDKPNEINSAFKQMLLDADKFFSTTPDEGVTTIHKQLKTLMKSLDKKQKYYKEIDKIFSRHQYNDNSILYCKKKNFKKQQLLLYFGSKEILILDYFETFMSQANAVTIRQEELAKDLKGSKRDIGKALKNLEEHGCITKIGYDRKLGTSYMLNPEIASVGNKTDHHGLFQKITPAEQLNKFHEINKLFADVTGLSITVTLADGTCTTVKSNLKVPKDE